MGVLLPLIHIIYKMDIFFRCHTLLVYIFLAPNMKIRNLMLQNDKCYCITFGIEEYYIMDVA